MIFNSFASALLLTVNVSGYFFSHYWRYAGSLMLEGIVANEKIILVVFLLLSPDHLEHFKAQKGGCQHKQLLL